MRSWGTGWRRAGAGSWGPVGEAAVGGRRVGETSTFGGFWGSFIHNVMSDDTGRAALTTGIINCRTSSSERW